MYTKQHFMEYHRWSELYNLTVIDFKFGSL